jgi:hypothetical protein
MTTPSNQTSQTTEPQVQPPEAPSAPTTPQPKLPLIIVCFVLIAAFVVAALLNPSEDIHLQEIDKAIRRRDFSASSAVLAVHYAASYNNLFLFSTVTFGNNYLMEDGCVLNYGFFGTVKTAGSIHPVMIAVANWEQAENAGK